MKNALIIEIIQLSRTLVLSGYFQHWKSSVQQTTCSTLKARINNDNSIDIEVAFKSGDSMEMSLINTSVVVIWE
jgi:hypothetical protein